MAGAYDYAVLELMSRAFQAAMNELHCGPYPDEKVRRAITSSILALADAGQRDWRCMASQAVSAARIVLDGQQFHS